MSAASGTKNTERLMKVLLAPVISEKGTFVGEKHNQYLFRVVSDATKPEIKAAVELMFSTKDRKIEVTNVQVSNVAAVRAEELYDQADYGSLNRNHAARLARMTSFLERNGLKHIHQPGESGAEFDARMRAAALPLAVRPASTLSAFIGALQRRLAR